MGADHVQKNKKSKKSLWPTAILGSLLGINAIIFGSKYEELRNIKNAVVFQQAIETGRPEFVVQEEILENLVNELPNDFKVATGEPMMNDIQNFRRREDGVWNFGIFVVGDMIVANNTLHNGTLFMTPHDSGKEFVVQGETTFKHITPYSLAVSPEIIIEIDVGDVFSPKVTLENLLIDQNPVPKEFVKERFIDAVVASNTLPLLVINCSELLAQGILSKDAVKDGKLIVNYAVRVETKKYPSLSKDDVGSMDDLKKFSRYAELVDPEKSFTIRMYDGAHPIVKHLAKMFSEGKTDPLEIAQACYSFSQRVIEYDITSKVPAVPTMVAWGNGKCIDYANLMTALLIECGIPAKVQAGPAGRNNQKDGAHAWVEFLLPLKDGSFQWVLSDPTWGDDSKERNKYLVSGEYHNEFLESDRKKLKHFYITGINVVMEQAEYSFKNTQEWKIK